MLDLKFGLDIGEKKHVYVSQEKCRQVYKRRKMPRKKHPTKQVTYMLPKGVREQIDAMIDGNGAYKDKELWKQKCYYICEYIATQNQMKSESQQEYVNIHQETMAKTVGVNNQGIARLLKQLVKASILEKDGIAIQAVVSQRGRQKVYIEEGKSYGYRFKAENPLETFEVQSHRQQYEKSNQSIKEIFSKYDRDLRSYNEVLKEIKIDTENLKEVIEEILKNKQKKKSQKENYESYLEEVEIKYRNNLLNSLKYYKGNNNQECKIYPFNGNIVPIKYEAETRTVSSYLTGEVDDENTADRSIDPNDEIYRTVSSYHVGEKDDQNNSDKTTAPVDQICRTVSSYQCKPRRFKIRSFMAKNRVKEKVLEPDETTIARCTKAVFTINEGYLFATRPVKDSRVYSAITNLNREFRSSIRLNGKKIVGIDIRNSQPLLACILIRHYWKEKQGELPEDVKRYQSRCEQGKFYDDFMGEIELPEDMRSMFKQDFFRKVFFSKVIEKGNVLKDMFIQKYPSCWEAITDVKGGLYCKDYGEFARMLQEVEAQIIYDVVNVGLLNQGIKAFNIFDSIYVTLKWESERAIGLINKIFQAFDLHPTLNVEYGEHFEENERKEIERHSQEFAKWEEQRKKDLAFKDMIRKSNPYGALTRS
ncbi:hypothetical protein DN068_12060 [Taibaiella soli]|uniref:Uncharacterized protein n=2 Tax=Taibaiella soli TaxID=1649169 RepID=A0A2W2BXK8_9BACT|nr:hypothetical protein DN068_12060 [Taibaiella soli]